MPRREDHKVHKGHVVALGGRKKCSLIDLHFSIAVSVYRRCKTLYGFFSFSVTENFDSGSDESTETSATDNANCENNTSSKRLRFHKRATDFSFLLRNDAASRLEFK